MADVDLQIEIGPGSAAGYPVVFRTTDGEEAPGTLQLPPTRVLEALAARVPDAVVASSARVRRAVTSDEAPVRELGRMLFDALMSGPGRALLLATRNRAVQQGGQIRLVLRMQAPELSRLPWEFLYDSGEDGYVCLDVPLVRHPQVAKPMEPLRVAPPLRILGMVARPEQQETLAVEAERQRLREALAGLVAEGRVELGWVTGQSWRDLRDAVRRDARLIPASQRSESRREWHVLHFIGHGGYDASAQEGALALAGERGETYLLGAGRLAMLLAGHPSLRLAVLNACETGRGDGLNPFSSVAGALMRKGLPAVLAMQYEVSDEAAVECAHSFYSALARQLPIDVAVMEARQTMALARPGTLEWGTPVLYMRSLEGQGHLFDLTDVPSPAEAPPPASDAAQQTADHVTGTTSEEARAALEELYADGLAALYTERWDEAVEAFRAVIARDRDYRDGQAKLAQARHGQRLAALYAAATAAAAAHDWAQAISHLEAVISTDSDYCDAPALLRQARSEQTHAQLREEIIALHRRKQWQAVLAAAERLHQHILTDAEPAADPELDAMISTARDAVEITNREEALARHYRQALDHLNAGRWQKALQSLDRVREIDPDYRATAQLAARARHRARSNVHIALQQLEPIKGQKAGRAKGASLDAIPLATIATTSVRDVTFSPDGTHLALACWDRTAVIVDEHGQVHLAVRHRGWKGAMPSNPSIWTVWFGSDRPIVGVGFSPDGRRLATASHDHSARIWDANTGTQLLNITHDEWVRAAVFSPDGTRLATASLKAVKLWQLSEGSNE